MKLNNNTASWFGSAALSALALGCALLMPPGVKADDPDPGGTCSWQEGSQSCSTSVNGCATCWCSSGHRVQCVADQTWDPQGCRC